MAPAWNDIDSLTGTQLPSTLFPVPLFLFCENQMCSKEGQNFGIDLAIIAPIQFVKRPGVFFSTVSNTEFMRPFQTVHRRDYRMAFSAQPSNAAPPPPESACSMSDLPVIASYHKQSPLYKTRRVPACFL